MDDPYEIHRRIWIRDRQDTPHSAFAEDRCLSSGAVDVDQPDVARSM